MCKRSAEFLNVAEDGAYIYHCAVNYEMCKFKIHTATTLKMHTIGNETVLC